MWWFLLTGSVLLGISLLMKPDKNDFVMSFFQPAFAVLAMAYFVLFVLYAFGSPPKDGTDYKSAQAFVVDAASGCQYIESRNGTLIPRVDFRGHHICKSSGRRE